MKNRGYNFSPGPAMLPIEVLLKAQEDLLSWNGSGMSIMEISHRSQEFVALAAEIEHDFREVFNVPENYKILFLTHLYIRKRFIHRLHFPLKINLDVSVNLEYSRLF